MTILSTSTHGLLFTSKPTCFQQKIYFWPTFFDLLRPFRPRAGVFEWALTIATNINFYSNIQGYSSLKSVLGCPQLLQIVHLLAWIVERPIFSSDADLSTTVIWAVRFSSNPQLDAVGPYKASEEIILDLANHFINIVTQHAFLTAFIESTLWRRPERLCLRITRKSNCSTSSICWASKSKRSMYSSIPSTVMR